MDTLIETRALLKTLPLQIADQLAESITDGKLTAGARLREAELASTYSVSRATIRESLRLLELRGLVSIEPQRGARVTQLSAKELYDLFAIRASLLSTASRLAAERCTEKEARILRKKQELLSKSVSNAAEYVNQSAAAIAVITSLADNETLAAYISDLAQRIGRYVRIGLSTPERRERSVALWKETIDAIIGGEADRASANHYRLAIQNRDAALREFEKTE